MFDRIMLLLGGVLSALGVGLGSMAIAAGPHQFGLQVAAVVCTSVGPTMLAFAPTLRPGTVTMQVGISGQPGQK